jgi:predicted XRE-type DNA-binding protein
MTLEKRFWSKVRKGPGCWEWTAGLNKRNGYGHIKSNGVKLLAHRLAWEMSNGRPIPAGLCVLHRCDNPKCVRPDHLFVGTQLDNIEDRDAKGRASGGSLCGSANKSAKLSADQVDEIRMWCRTGFSQRSVAPIYGITQAQASRIVTGKLWRPA